MKSFIFTLQVGNIPASCEYLVIVQTNYLTDKEYKMNAIFYLDTLFGNRNYNILDVEENPQETVFRLDAWERLK
jgi:hypothetical protein